MLINCLVLRGDEQPAALGHGIPGVDAEIEKYLVDLRGIAFDLPKLRRNGCGDGDVFWKSLVHHLLHVAHEAV